MNCNFLKLLLFGGVFFYCDVNADGCTPYTEEACQAAGENLNLDVSDISGGLGDIKGCFAYTIKDADNAGKVYFNPGGTEEEMKSALNKTNNLFRPLGHDCKKPNIIFLLADDMGYNDIGYNNPHVQTPNMNNLAEEGIKLEQNYVQATCTPSRIAFLSGMYPYHVGRQNSVLMWNTPTGLSLNRSTIGDAMKDLGYDTYVIGKWHVGDCNDKYLPLSRGFDKFYGLTGAMTHYVTKTIFGITDWWDTENGELKQIKKDENATAFETHSTTQYEDRIKALISTYKDSTSANPFFMYLPMQLPHTPFDGENTPEKYQNMYDNSVFQDSDRYKDHPTYDENSASGLYNHLGVVRLVSMLDDLVDNIITSLKDNELYENTVFVFSSDNGGMLGAQVGNFPYKGFKTTPYEGGTKVPGFVHSPLLPTSEDFSGMNHITDWFPTFMRLGGESKESVDGKKFDGVDQLETLFGGQNANPRNRIVYNIRNQQVWNTLFPLFKTSGWIRDGNWKYGRFWLYEGIEFHVLYDLLNDPTEQQNVAFDNTDQLNTMKALFDELAESMVPADEPFGVPPNVYINDGYLADGWCKEEDLYFDPCTSGPCSGADMNECNADPCINGGICQDKNNDYTCHCIPGSGWGGKNCEEDISWGEWSEWSNCTYVCEENGTKENPKGTQTRSRNCNIASCVGDETETRECTGYCSVCKDKIGKSKCNKKKKNCKKNWELRNISCQKTCGTCE